MLVHSKNTRTGDTIFMRAIDQKEEDRLDRLSSKQNIYMYGDIDLNNPKDVEHIKNHNLVETNGLGMLYNNFDYEAGEFGLVDQLVAGTIEGVVKWGPCTDPIEWFKFNHCLLGKPDKIVVYNAIYGELWEPGKKWR